MGPRRPHEHKDPTFWLKFHKKGIPDMVLVLMWSFEGPYKWGCRETPCTVMRPCTLWTASQAISMLLHFGNRHARGLNGDSLVSG